MSKCELCKSPAQTLCESDQAILCWECDGKVHGANFLVSRHSRTLLCHHCKSPTPWRASGPALGHTVSLCTSCATHSTAPPNHTQPPDDDDDPETDDEEDDDDPETDDAADEYEEDVQDEEEEEGENQVVPGSSTPPPPAASYSSSSDDDTVLTLFSRKRTIQHLHSPDDRSTDSMAADESELKNRRVEPVQRRLRGRDRHHSGGQSVR